MVRTLVLLLVVHVLLSAFACFSGVDELDLLERIPGGTVGIQEAIDLDDLQATIGAMQLVVLLFTGAGFVAWTYVMYGNLEALGAGPLRFGKGWAAGAWFVPILNLVRPKQIVNDIWRASDPVVPPQAAGAWAGRPVPFFINLWWLFFLVAGVLSRFLIRTVQDSDSLATLQNAARLTLAADIVGVLLGLTAIVVVKQVSARQAARAVALAIDANVGAEGPLR